MARYDEDGRQVLDTAALDRHITGNYGEDQLSCSDVDDPLYEPYGSDVPEDLDDDLDTEDDEEDWDDDEELGDDDEEGDD